MGKLAQDRRKPHHVNGASIAAYHAGVLGMPRISAAQPRLQVTTHCRARKGHVHKKQLAIVDEHEVFRRGVVSVLAEDPCVQIIHESAHGAPPPSSDVVVASPLAFGDIDPSHPVVVCWGSSDRPLAPPNGRRVAIMERDRLRSDELVAAVRALAAGLCLERAGNGQPVPGELDLRRRHILQLLSQGADTRGISASLFYSERTVKGLIRDIEQQLSARNRAEAVAKGIRLGLI